MLYLVLMLVGLLGSWKAPIAYFYTDHIDTQHLAQIIKTSLGGQTPLLQQYAFSVNMRTVLPRLKAHALISEVHPVADPSGGLPGRGRGVTLSSN